MRKYRLKITPMIEGAGEWYMPQIQRRPFGKWENLHKRNISDKDNARKIIREEKKKNGDYKPVTTYEYL